MSAHVKSIVYDWKIKNIKDLSYGTRVLGPEHILRSNLKINLSLTRARKNLLLFINEITSEFPDIDLLCKVCLMDKKWEERYAKTDTVNFKIEGSKRLLSWTWRKVDECTRYGDTVIIRCYLSMLRDGHCIPLIGGSINTRCEKEVLEKAIQTEKRDLMGYGNGVDQATQTYDHVCSGLFCLKCRINSIIYPRIYPLYLQGKDDLFGKILKNCFITLQSDLQDMYSNKIETDCVLKVGDTNFPAHRALLSVRSTVFAAMFHHNTKESQDGEVIISDVEAETLDSLLFFIYTGKIRELTANSAIQMYIAADKYAMLELRQICLGFLMFNLTIENVFKVAYLAYVYGEEMLEREVLRFIGIMMKEVLESNEWRIFSEEKPVLANKILSAAFLLRCEKVVDQSTQTEEHNYLDTASNNFLDTLQNDLQNMYDKKTESDCFLKVGGRNIPAHRALLATRSTVFADMFHQYTNTSKNWEVEISDVEPATLDSLLHFIYTDKICELTPTSSVQIYTAADKYDILKLKEVCLDFLLCNLTIENVIDAAHLAHVHAEEELEEAVTSFIEKNLEIVLESKEWKTFLEDTPVLANNILAAAFIAVCIR